MSENTIRILFNKIDALSSKLTTMTARIIKVETLLAERTENKHDYKETARWCITTALATIAVMISAYAACH